MKAYILIDRSGSMAANWVETIGAVNAYSDELKANKKTAKTEITVAMFDSQEPYKVIRQDIKAKDWTPIATTEAMPRGLTPLYDAIGTLNQVITLANPEKASIIIVTDGAENSSREVTRDTSKKILDDLKVKGYDVSFIGADFNAFAQGSSVGVMQNATLNMTKGNYDKAFRSMAAKTGLYGEAGPEAVLNFFTAEVRAGAAGK